MATPPIPVNRYLVPGGTPSAPDGFTLVDQEMLQGLPYVIPLDGDARLLLILPNGLAVTWRDADPAAVVTRSDEELAPAAAGFTLPIADEVRPPARLLLQTGNTPAAAVPLAAGRRTFVPDSGAGVSFEIAILSWDLRAGTLRGPGSFGSRISLAWRKADAAVDQFATPPPNVRAIERLGVEFKLASTVGTLAAMLPKRFTYKKVVLR
jgi:hypothetical protein